MPVVDPNTADELVPVERVAARVLPVNDRGEVLLLRGFEPAHPDHLFWFSVGGGLEDDEDARAAAVRQMAEETGIIAAEDRLQGPLLSEIAEFTWGKYAITQSKTWWAVPVGDPDVSFARLDETERTTTVNYGWWTTEALAASGQPCVSGLLDLMRVATNIPRLNGRLAVLTAADWHRDALVPSTLSVAPLCDWLRAAGAVPQ